MYLAPLNSDYFFRKIFSDLVIAKAYLEDMLDVQIQHIERLPHKNKLTDASLQIEFDFRCIIDNQPVLVEMQQDYKSQVVKRFYLYHTVATALQLENIAVLQATKKGNEKRKVLLYGSLEPVVTIIWMVDDTLDFEDDWVGFTMLPERLCSFILKEDFWTNPAVSEQVSQEREQLAALLKNNSKSLDFLRKNRLIYAFQPNIVKNKKNEKYFRWYDFAQKTLNKNNAKPDFRQYEKDEIMQRIMHRLNKEVLDEEDWKHVKSFEEIREELIALKPDFVAEGREEGIRIGKKIGEAIGEAKGIRIGEAKGIQIGEAKGIQIGEAKGIRIGKAEATAAAQEKLRLEMLETARTLKKSGVPIDLIEKATKLKREEIEKL